MARKPFVLPKELETPANLSKEGKNAVTAIVRLLKKHHATHMGGCKAFYSPIEWAARGEKYGCNSVLVLVHDGGALRDFCNYDAECPSRIEAMIKALEPLGLYVESCTGWYSAVYESSPAPKAAYVELETAGD